VGCVGTILSMTASSARSRLVLLQAAARPTATSSTAGPHGAKIRRYRLARAHLQAQRTQSLAVATDVMAQRRAAV
jgi:hypothetical protein